MPVALFVLVAAIISALIALRLHAASSSTPSSATFTRAKHIVIVVVDGAGTSSLRASALSNLRRLANVGVTYSNAWVGQAETAPASSNASIATGAFPRSHGLLGDVWYDAHAKRVVRPTLFNDVLVGSIDAVMEPSQIEGLASQIKGHNPNARVLSVAGKNCATAAAAGTWLADAVVCAQRARRQWRAVTVAGHDLPVSAGGTRSIRAPVFFGRRSKPALAGWHLGGQDIWIARETVAAMRAIRPVLTFVTLPELAMLELSSGRAESRQSRATVLASVDQALGQIIDGTKRDGTFKDTVFVVTSGRAIAPALTVQSRRTLTNAIIDAGGEPTYIVGDGAAYIGLKDPLQAQPVAQALEGAGAHGVDAIFYKAGSSSATHYSAQFIDPTASAGFARTCASLLRTLASPFSPDVVVIYRQGTGLRANPPQRLPMLSVGFQWQNQGIPLIVAGHGTFAGRVSHWPARLVDIAPTLETALGLAPAGEGLVLPDALFGIPRNAKIKTTESALAGEVRALQSR